MFIRHSKVLKFRGSHGYIWNFRRKNKSYSYEFYDDERIDSFIKSNFDTTVYEAYSQLQIGAATADFFRYAILYIYDGVYLDLDSDILISLDTVLTDEDTAVITREEDIIRSFLCSGD